MSLFLSFRAFDKVRDGDSVLPVLFDAERHPPGVRCPGALPEGVEVPRRAETMAQSSITARINAVTTEYTVCVLRRFGVGGQAVHLAIQRDNIERTGD